MCVCPISLTSPLLLLALVAIAGAGYIISVRNAQKPLVVLGASIHTTVFPLQYVQLRSTTVFVPSHLNYVLLVVSLTYDTFASTILPILVVVVHVL